MLLSYCIPSIKNKNVLVNQRWFATLAKNFLPTKIHIQLALTCIYGKLPTSSPWQHLQCSCLSQATSLHTRTAPHSVRRGVYIRSHDHREQVIIRINTKKSYGPLLTAKHYTLTNSCLPSLSNTTVSNACWMNIPSSRSSRNLFGYNDTINDIT